MSNCGVQAKVEDQPLPEIRVNGVLIDEALYARELQYHQAASFEKALHKAGQALVIRQILMNELGDNVEDEEVAVAELIEKNSVPSNPTEEDCRRYFDNNRARFNTESLLEADHILLAAAKDDLEERSNARKKAADIISQLKNNPELFASLAEQYSICPSKKTGGSLGQLGKGQTVPEFEKQIMRLPEGLADESIESRYGLHVVRINRKIEGRPLEYSMAFDKIKHYLTQRASQLSIQAYIQTLVEKTDIEGIHIGFADENIVV